MLEGNLWSEPSPFQEDYFEHVIRDVDSLEKIRDYVRTNPVRWRQDSKKTDRQPGGKLANEWDWLGESLM
jgi:hypothetical protein